MSDAEKKRAADDLSIIKELKSYRPFSDYFLRRLNEKIAARTRLALDVDISPEETTIEKRVIEALQKDVVSLLDQDEAGCRSILRE